MTVRVTSPGRTFVRLLLAAALFAATLGFCELFAPRYDFPPQDWSLLDEWRAR